MIKILVKQPTVCETKAGSSFITYSEFESCIKVVDMGSFKEYIKDKIRWQFNYGHNLSDEAYEDLIAEQVVEYLQEQIGEK